MRERKRYDDCLRMDLRNASAAIARARARGDLQRIESAIAAHERASDWRPCVRRLRELCTRGETDCSTSTAQRRPLRTRRRARSTTTAATRSGTATSSAGRMHRYRPRDRRDAARGRFPSEVGSLGLAESGRLVVALRHDGRPVRSGHGSFRRDRRDRGRDAAATRASTTARSAPTAPSGSAPWTTAAGR